MESYANAAKLFYKCQKAAITIRKSVVLLVTQIAIENSLKHLHNDRDFTRLMTVEKRLKSYQTLSQTTQTKNPKNQALAIALRSIDLPGNCMP